MKFNWHIKEALLELIYLAGNMPLFTPSHSFRSCDGPKVFTSTTIFRKCVGRLAGTLHSEDPLGGVPLLYVYTLLFVSSFAAKLDDVTTW